MHLRRIGFVLVGLLLSSCGGGSASPAGSEAAGATNTAPTISSTGNTSLSENTTQVMSVSARDADGDTLSFSLSGDDAQLLRIDADGALSFTTAPDFEAPADADEDNVYIVTVRVSDGSANAELAVTATVTNDPADDFQLAASSFSSGTAIPLIHACVAYWPTVPSGVLMLEEHAGLLAYCPLRGSNARGACGPTGLLSPPGF